MSEPARATRHSGYGFFQLILYRAVSARPRLVTSKPAITMGHTKGREAIATQKATLQPLASRGENHHAAENGGHQNQQQRQN